MAGETRSTVYKEALSRNLQCLQGTLATAWTTSIARGRQCRTRVLAWGSAGVAAARDSVKRVVAVLRRHSAATVGIALLIVAILALWKIPLWQIPEQGLTVKERLELQDKARGTLAQIFGGLVVLGGLYLTWRSVAAAWKNVQVNAEGQITERFTRAIEQLGSDKLAIRLGGIYALERIARDSPKDHWPIMEVLTAYVREHAPWKDTPQPQEGITPELEEPTLEGSVQPETLQPEPKPAADIQAILTVLGRRRRWYGQGENQPLDLRKTDLAGADLPDAHLERANGITKEQLDSAIIDEGTRLPAYLTTEEAHGK